MTAHSDKAKAQLVWICSLVEPRAAYPEERGSSNNHTMKLFFIFLQLFFAVSLCHAQIWQWAYLAKADVYSNANSLLVNKNGNINCTGQFIGFCSRYSIEDCFALLEISPDGAFLNMSTIKRTSETSPQEFFAQSLSEDSAGYIYLHGNSKNDVTWDTIATNFAEEKGIYAKYNQEADIQSLDTMGSVVSYSAHDVQGDTYITGRFHDTLDYVDTFSLHNLTQPPGGLFYIAKFDAQNNCIWARQSYGDRGSWFIPHISSNAIYITLLADSCVTFDTATLCNTSPGYPVLSVHMLKLNTNGQVIKVMPFSTAHIGGGVFRGVDNEENAYITFTYDSTITFDVTTISKLPGSSTNAALAKLDSNDNLVWMKPILGTGYISAGGIILPNGEAYVTGEFSGTAIFGTDTIVAQHATDNYIARYDNDGNFVGIKTFGSDTSGGSWPSTLDINSIDVDSVGNIYICGQLMGSWDFDGTALSTNPPGDFFMAKLSPITGINNIEESSSKNDELKIFANPNDGRFTIVVPTDLHNKQGIGLEVFDATGASVLKQQVNTNSETWPVEAGTLRTGLYTVRLTQGKNVYTGSVVIR